MEGLNVLKPMIRKPYQKVRINRAEIWTNRSPEKWHLKFPDIGSSIIAGCPDGRCPYDMHGLAEYSFSDPWSLGAIFKLKKSMKVLVLIEYCNKEHVAFFTFDHFNECLGIIQFYSEEISKNCWFFNPSTNEDDDFAVTIQWDCIKYLAIVDSQEPSFGKYGGLACFKRELSRLTGVKIRDITTALTELDSLNPIPKKPSLKPCLINAFHIYENFKEKKGIIKLLNIYSQDEYLVIELGHLFLLLMVRDEFKKFCVAMKGWKPKDNALLRKGLEHAVLWYFQRAPTQGMLIQGWWNSWNRLFNIGEMPQLRDQ